MVKTLTKDNHRSEEKPEAATTRRYKPEEFDADTNEERSVALLAEIRRQFLTRLKAFYAEPKIM